MLFRVENFVSGIKYLFSCDKWPEFSYKQNPLKSVTGYSISCDCSRAMFTLYRIGICSVSNVALVQCEQELMFCYGAEIVPKRSQCELEPYPLCNLSRSLLISKDNLPKRGSVAISAPIKVFRLDSYRFKNLSDTECSTFNSGAEQYCSGAENASKAAFLNRSPYWVHFLRRSVSLAGTV